MIDYDRTQLPDRLELAQSEFSWLIFEGQGSSRRFAGLTCIHRTGPRPTSLSWGLELLTGRDLPSPLSRVIPSWLPVLSPVRVKTDDRPLFTLALYDLDAKRLALHFEHEIEHANFDAARFSATGSADDLAWQADATGRVHLRVRRDDLALDLRFEPLKPQVMFGDNTPAIRHGRILTHYVQRPRLAVHGDIHLGATTLTGFAGEGVHDHQWLRVSVPNIKWMWPHLRLPDGRELTGYVIRDSIRGRNADADDGSELGRNGWIIERDGTVRPLRSFDVRALAHVETERGRVPTTFEVSAPELGPNLIVNHIIPAPYLPMRAFGDVVDAGIYEGPIDVDGAPGIRGWVEIMNAAHVMRRAGRD